MRFKQLTMLAALVAGIGLAGGAPKASADVMDQIKEPTRSWWASAPITAPTVISIRTATTSASSPSSPATFGVEHEFVPVVASNRMEFLRKFCLNADAAFRGVAFPT